MLRLSLKQLRDEGVCETVSSLDPSLTMIDLSCNSFGPVGLSALLAAVAACPMVGSVVAVHLA
jgi:hypothetical protein